MFVCCECCVLSGRGLCDELITHPEESYRLWCVIVCDLETSKWEGHDPRWVAEPQKKNTHIYVYVVLHTSSSFYNCLTYFDIQRTVHRNIFL
jgi:hypothetical protein